MPVLGARVQLLEMIAALVTALALAAEVPAELRARVLADYASGAEQAYLASARSATTLLERVQALCQQPTESGLAAARQAWSRARTDYGRTEVYRYGGGPIDARAGGVETFVNAWPVDEAFIEPADRPARTGIIADRVRYPVLAAAVIREHNQRGGETNVCTGWHAIEFMLWGRDTSATGPGDRPVGDFIDGEAPDADRRREFLVEITRGLRDDLVRVADRWHGEHGAWRAALVASPARGMRAMCIGPALLAGYEMSGERLAVALETSDQEEEQSCFSDSTDADFRADLDGIERVLRGSGASPGLLGLVRSVDEARATALEASLVAARSAVDAMPHPFDAAIRAGEESPQRMSLVTAMHALERLSSEISAAARSMGIELPTQPQG